MGEVYLSPGFIPGHNHPVCCHLPSDVIFSHSNVMANTLWLLLSAVASAVSKYHRSWRCTRVLGILCFEGKLQLCISLVSFHISCSKPSGLQEQFLSSLKLDLPSFGCWECEPTAKCWGSKDTLSKDIKRKTFLAVKTRVTIPLHGTRNVRQECLLSSGLIFHTGRMCKQTQQAPGPNTAQV